MSNSLTEKQRAKRKTSYQEYRAKLKADPVRYEAYLERQRVYQREYIEKLKVDPVRYEAYLERQRAYQREYKAMVMADPIKAEKSRAYRRAYKQRPYVKAQRRLEKKRWKARRRMRLRYG